MISQGITRMQPAFSRKINLMRLLGRFKSSEGDPFMVSSDSCRPSAAVFVLLDSKKTGFVMASSHSDVLLVDASGRFPKIGPCVVGSFAINMVNAVAGPFAGHVKPCKAVCVIETGAKANLNITTHINRASAHVGFTPAHPAPGTWYPNKIPRLWVILEVVAQTLCGKIGLIHEAPFQRIGQRPVRVTSASGLRYFNA